MLTLVAALLNLNLLRPPKNLSHEVATGADYIYVY